jgi:Ca2+-binding RTX toxin-like protein
LIGGLGNDFLVGGAGLDTLIGGDGDDTLYATETSAYTGFLESSDSLDTSADSLDGGNGNDSLVGNNGNNTFTDLVGDNRLYGFGGADSLTTGAGNDYLYGGAGNDVLNSGTGMDTVYGGSGLDRFVLNAATGLTIADFVLGTDTLSFAGLSSQVFSTSFNVGTNYFSVDINNDSIIDFGVTLSGVGTPPAVASAFDVGLGQWILTLL